MISSLLINCGFFWLASLFFFYVCQLILPLCWYLGSPWLWVDLRPKAAPFGIPW